MKIIFLDIDGVLNSSKFMQENIDKFNDPSGEIDPKAVRYLNEIMDRTGAKVVISSTWRHGYSLSELRTRLRKVGFNGSIVGVTPNDPKHKIRGEEIQAWLDSNKGIESFVILDDDSDMGNLTSRLVKTNYILGLQESHVDSAIKMLDRYLD